MPGREFVRRGVGPWHKPGAPCAPRSPDHRYHVDAKAGPMALPVFGECCTTCYPEAIR